MLSLSATQYIPTAHVTTKTEAASPDLFGYAPCATLRERIVHCNSIIVTMVVGPKAEAVVGVQDATVTSIHSSITSSFRR
jgi:hypothetical protein